MDEYWACLYCDFLKWERAELSEERSAAIDRLKVDFVQAFRSASPQQRNALRALLHVEPEMATAVWTSLFAAAVLWNVAFKGDGLADEFFKPLVEAAIAEGNPSVNRCYVEPCLMAFGRRRTIAELERRLALSEDSMLTARIESALYWTRWPIDEFADYDTQKNS